MKALLVKQKKHKNNEMKGKNDAHAGPFDNIIHLTSETLLGKTYCHRIIIYLCSRIIRAYFFFLVSIHILNSILNSTLTKWFHFIGILIK